MKKYLFLAVLFSISVIIAQEFPRGIYLGPRSSSINYDVLIDSLKLNLVEATISNTSDALFSKTFNLLIREINLWEYSTGQQMIYEAKKDHPTEQWAYNYFATKVGVLQDTLWRFRKSIDPAGLVIKDAVPDSEYNFLQYGKKWYTAKFIMKADTAGLSKTTLIADVRVWGFAYDSNGYKVQTSIDSLQLRASDFAGSGTLKTFQVHFSVDSVSVPPNPRKRWDRLTGGELSIPLYQEKIDLQVYWYKAADAWLQKVIVEDDSIGKKLFALSLDNSITDTASLYLSSLLKRFYLYDEPPVSALRGVDHVDKKLQSAMSIAGITATFWNGSKLDRFISDANPIEILADPYVINTGVPYPGFSDARSDSLGLTHYTTYSYKIGLNERLFTLDNVLSDVAIKVKNTSPPKTFWNVVQLNGIYSRTDYHYSLRPLTASEIQTTIGTGLAFGARGILGWVYRTYFDLNYVYTGVVDTNYNHNSNFLSVDGRSIYGGFIEVWKGYMQAMKKVDTLSTVLSTLSWQGLKRWFYTPDNPTYGTWNGLVTSVTTKSTTGVEDSIYQKYVVTGHLTYGGKDYILVVNRRCDTMDTRNMTMYLKDTTTQWRVTEISTTDTTITNDNSSFTKQFLPGDWKLFKILQQGPSVPQNVSVSSYSTHPKVSWRKNTPASPLQSISGYEVYRNPGGLIATVSATDSFYVDNQAKVGSHGTTIYYWVKAKDVTNLVSAVSAQVSIGITQWQEKRQGNTEEELIDLPKEFSLRPNYPNPFNPTTTIKYELPQDVFVTMKIFNQLGQEIRTLVNGQKSAGRYQVEWNAKGLASGIYICKIEAGIFKHSLKMLLTK